MKYIKFTYVDAVTGISIASQPAASGPVFPPVAGLAYEWARESRYPTDVPEFFGTCPDDSNTQVDGVLGVFGQADWEQMRADEMTARIKVPASVTMRQARLALLAVGKLATIETVIAGIEPVEQRQAIQIEWEYAQTVDRTSPWVASLAPALGLSAEDLDSLFIFAATQ
jgi:hypothetical protein